LLLFRVRDALRIRRLCRVVRDFGVRCRHCGNDDALRWLRVDLKRKRIEQRGQV
jgi:hypothetical protein